MSWRFWTAMLAGTAAGFYGYRRLRQMEQDIRREIGQGTGGRRMAPAAPKPAPAVATKAPPAAPSLQERLLQALKDRPGRLQTEFYPEFPQEDRRTLQDLLARMEQEGRIRRERERSTYRIYASEE